MNKKFINRILSMFLLISILFSNSFTLLSSSHTDITSAYLTKIGDVDYHLKYDNGIRDSFVICSVVGHYIGDKFYPAYCVNPELPGAETTPYDVAIREVLHNDAVWRALVNGYPYQSAESMGLSEFDAYFVTKMAVYCALGKSDINRFSYNVGDSVGEKMLRKLQEIVNIALNGTDTMQTGTLNYTKIGELTESGNYYYQEYSVNSRVELTNYSIVNVAGFGDGSYIGNLDGNVQTSYSNGEHFRIYIPKSNMTSDIDGAISVVAKTKIYPILYGESGNSELQNYAITSDPYGDEDIVVDLKIPVNNGRIEINKTDDTTSQPVKDVTFGLYKDGIEVARATTDSNGVANFNNLYSGNYILKEIETNPNYVINNQEFTVNVEYNGFVKLDIQNEYKEGNIKVIIS